MKILKISFRLIVNLFLFPVYFLSGFFPRDKKMVAYGCPRNGFSDNAKYAYFYDSVNARDGLSRYWITSDKKLIAKFAKHKGMNFTRRMSLTGIWIALRAGTYVYSSYASDVNFWLSRNARLVNYWHGLPLKKIEFDISSGKLMRRYNPSNFFDRIFSILYFIYHPAVFKRPNLLCSPIPKFNAIFANAFRVDRTAIFEEDYPRWRYIRGDNSIDTALAHNIPYKKNLSSFHNIFLYLPTFRDADNFWIKDHLLGCLKTIDSYLCKHNNFLLIKLHPNDFFLVEDEYNNLQFLDPSEDAVPILKYADVVITDYSSVMIDAAVCGKEIVLYWPDLTDYMTKSRESYFDLESIFKGKPILNDCDFKCFFDTQNLSVRSVKKEIINEFVI